MEEKREFKNLEFNLNKPVTLTLTYNAPLIREGAYGTFYVYGCKVEDENFNFVASGKFYEEIYAAGYSKGDILIITKEAVENKGKLSSHYIVKCKERVSHKEEKSNKSEYKEPKEKISHEIWDEKDRRMVRMNSLAHATEFVARQAGFQGLETDLYAIFDMAEQFCAYVYTGKFKTPTMIEEGFRSDILSEDERFEEEIVNAEEQEKISKSNHIRAKELSRKIGEIIPEWNDKIYHSQLKTRFQVDKTTDLTKEHGAEWIKILVEILNESSAKNDDRGED